MQGNPSAVTEGTEVKTAENADNTGDTGEGTGDDETGSEAEEPAQDLRTAAVDPAPAEFHPHAVESTQPSNLIQYTNILLDGELLSGPSEYQPDGNISFGTGSEYTEVEGIVGFRGNNFRNRPAYGFASYKDLKLNSVWSVETSSLSHNGNYWSGSGWTGQCLMQKWPKEVKAHMNMYDSAKNKDDLVEVIYACMDGHVYFLDLETGERTRDDLFLGYTFKGAGALDPRGYPIMYLGAGINSDEGNARVFIINLLDCSTMYQFGYADYDYELRNVTFYDSSALVDAETDTLIYPGENGILYMMKLNTNYDKDAGTLSVNPSHVVKWRYWGTRTSDYSYWLGMEDSAVAYEGYLFVADNGGNFMCINLNTMELVWVQDVLDDTNCSPVASVEDGHLYLYISTSFHLGWRSYDVATIPIWKIDAETGEIVWHTDYNCETVEDLSGGVQSTIACGEHDLSDYIYVTVSRTGESYEGVLACISKSDGKVNWEHRSGYAWSSPVCIYSQTDDGQVIYCSSDGKMYLIDGHTGAEHDALALSDGVIEASPAVYNNHIVVGTRDCHIWQVDLT
ncbi:MAG: PQQ-binding-like beta-propeller repeat protein [Blautia sp.]|nr:PQQ-binding-like beta-propeller repeat protein [Blautia sp.]